MGCQAEVVLGVQSHLALDTQDAFIFKGSGCLILVLMCSSPGIHSVGCQVGSDTSSRQFACIPGPYIYDGGEVSDAMLG